MLVTASKAQRAADAGNSHRLLTIPNVLCLIRLVGAGVLIVLALNGQPYVFLGLYLFLVATDWVDGKLARWLDQRSVFGARLDSAADASLYTALLLGCLWLKWDVLQHEIGWILPAVASYALTSGVGLWRFGRWPSYHTRGAKSTWLLITIGVVCLVGGWALWPLRIAMLAVMLTNVEATLISFTLRQWRADVPSLYHAWRIRKAGG